MTSKFRLNFLQQQVLLHHPRVPKKHLPFLSCGGEATTDPHKPSWEKILLPQEIQCLFTSSTHLLHLPVQEGHKQKRNAIPPPNPGFQFSFCHLTLIGFQDVHGVPNLQGELIRSPGIVVVESWTEGTLLLAQARQQFQLSHHTTALITHYCHSQPPC